VELLLARAEALLELELELELAGGLELPCTQRKSQACRGQAGSAARWIQRPRLLLPRRQMLCSFFYFQKPGRQELPRQVETYAHSQVVIRLDFRSKAMESRFRAARPTPQVLRTLRKCNCGRNEY
jgi:hypothetical protein